nr:3-deoxy-7-phosphoheptulonate synthase [uncultured Desulfobacter sp.]
MNILRLSATPDLSQQQHEITILKKICPEAERISDTCFVRVNDCIHGQDFLALDFVREVVDDVPPYPLSCRKLMAIPPWVALGRDDDPAGERIGDGCAPLIIAGPCAVETWDRTAAIAQDLSELGIKYMRGGAYKPRTSPYGFQGLKKDGLEILNRIKREFGLKIVTEVMSTGKIDEVSEVADILQVGTRNMFHYAFLEELGKSNTPVLLKRGMAAAMKEWLLGAEYILSRGNRRVILCERGIKTFETATRNTLDLGVVSLVKQRSLLPVVVDPSHATGRRSLIEPMSLAAMACGADGLEIEVHNDPDNAWVDGHQSITPKALGRLLDKLNIARRQAAAAVPA